MATWYDELFGQPTGVGNQSWYDEAFGLPDEVFTAERPAVGLTMDITPEQIKNPAPPEPSPYTRELPPDVDPSQFDVSSFGSVPRFYQPESLADVDAERSADQFAKPPTAGLMETAGMIGGQLYDAAAYHVPGAFASALEGSDPYAERDWKDKLIERARARAEERQPYFGNRPTALGFADERDITGLGPSLGFSASGMGAGLGSGLAATAALAPVSGPAALVGGYAAGGLASGAAAYRMATNSFVRDLRDTLDQERAELNQPPISDEEFSRKAEELSGAIREYGLWEAVPEAAGNVLGFGILKAGAKDAIGRIFGKNVLTRVVTKTAGVFGTELATETATGMGQHNVNVGVGLMDGPRRSWTNWDDLGETFSEVAPATILQTALLAGGTKAGMMLQDRIQRGNLTREQYDLMMEFNNQVERGQINPEAARKAALETLDPLANQSHQLRYTEQPSGGILPGFDAAFNQAARDIDDAETLFEQEETQQWGPDTFGTPVIPTESVPWAIETQEVPRETLETLSDTLPSAMGQNQAFAPLMGGVAPKRAVADTGAIDTDRMTDEEFDQWYMNTEREAMQPLMDARKSSTQGRAWRTEYNPAKDGFLEMLAKRGGLDADAFESEGFDVKGLKERKDGFNNNRIPGSPIIRGKGKGGLKPDDVAEIISGLVQDGTMVVPQDILDEHGRTTVNDVLDVLAQEINGTQVIVSPLKADLDQQEERIRRQLEDVRYRRENFSQIQEIESQDASLLADIESIPTHEKEFYNPEWDAKTRTLADWADDALEEGISEQEIRPILDSELPVPERVLAINQLIEAKRDERYYERLEAAFRSRDSGPLPTEAQGRPQAETPRPQELEQGSAQAQVTGSDLLGQDTSKQQALRDTARAKDDKRSGKPGTETVPVEAGAGELFAGQQPAGLFEQQVKKDRVIRIETTEGPDEMSESEARRRLAENLTDDAIHELDAHERALAEAERDAIKAELEKVDNATVQSAAPAPSETQTQIPPKQQWSAAIAKAEAEWTRFDLGQRDYFRSRAGFKGKENAWINKTEWADLTLSIQREFGKRYLPDTPAAAADSAALGVTTSETELPPSEPADIDAAANQAATSPKNDLPQPTKAQKEAISDFGSVIQGADVLYSGYERDTGNLPIEQKRAAYESAAQLAFDLEPPADVPVARDQLADNFNTHYRHVAVAEFRIGVERVTNAEEAAHVFSVIRKNASEVFYALVLGQGGKILDLQLHSIGTRDAANVYPSTVIPSVVAVPGAKQVYFAHNHPSGLPEPSQADHAITEVLNNALNGTGVTLGGHITLGYGSNAVWFDNNMNTRPVKIIPRLRKLSVKVTERKARKIPPKDRPTLERPDVAYSAVNALEADNAVLLLDTRHRAIGSLALTEKEMVTLKDSGSVRRILTAIDSTNAAAAIIKATTEEAATNVARFLTQNGSVRALDAFVGDDKIGRASRGEMQDLKSGIWFERGIDLSDRGPGALSPSEKMVVQHNLSAAKLRHADKMGGMPMPSIGISRAAHPLEGYGDITLLAKPGLVSPSAKNPVYSADAYTSTYPTITYFLSEADRSKLLKFISEPFGVDRPWKVPSSTEGYNQGRYIGDITDDGTFERRGIEGLESSDELRARYLWEKDAMPSIKEYPDRRAWQNALRDAVKDDPKYAAWAETLAERLDIRQEEKLFNGTTNMGRPRYVPNTLENVVKRMKKDMRENQTGMFGAGALRAQVAPKFRTMGALQKARDRLVSAEEMEKTKSEFNDRLVDISSKFTEYAKYVDSNPFIAGDRVRDQLTEISAGLSRWDEYFNDVPQDLKDEWNAYIKDLVNAPTAYFEAKPHRVVQLQEFEKALVPENAPDDVVAILKRHGLTVERYTDAADKARRIMADESILFTRSQNAQPTRRAEKGRQTFLTRQLERAMARFTGNPVEAGTYTQVESPKRHAASVKAVERVFGRRVVFFRANKPTGFSFNGVVLPGDTKSIYVNIDSQNPFMGVVGHELLHTLRREHPDLYDRLARMARSRLKTTGFADFAEMLDSKIRENKGDKRLSDDAMFEEMVANIVGDAFLDPAFVSELRQMDQNFLQRLVDAIVEILRSFQKRLTTRGMGSSQYFNDVENLIGQVQSVLREQARAKPAKASRARPFSEAPAFQQKPANDTFYSALTEIVEKAEGMPKKGSPAQFKQWLDGQQRKGNFKKEERDWMGVDEWLDGQSEVTREALRAFVAANQVEVEETLLGETDESDVEAWWNDEGGANEETPFGELSPTERREAVARYADEVGQYEENGTATKFGAYQLPGGENYRELLLTLPTGRELPEGFEAREKRNQATGYVGWIIHGPGPLEENQYGSGATREEAINAFIGNGHTGAFRSSHFDQPNVLTHVRFNERLIDTTSVDDIEARILQAIPSAKTAKSLGSGAPTVAVRKGLITEAEAADWSRARGMNSIYKDLPGTGKRTLFLEEIQSDWHQAGRRQGYANKPLSQEPMVAKVNNSAADPYWEVRTESGVFVANVVDVDVVQGNEQRAVDEARRLADSRADRRIPDAPFKKSWPLLAVKRMIRYAAENGFDSIAWTTGEQQAERYDLSKQINSIDVRKLDTGKFVVYANKNNEQVLQKVTEPEGLAEVVGKDLADKVMRDASLHTNAGQGAFSKQYSGLDLKVGGEGMKGFYDKILPAEVNKYVKKWGGRVGETHLDKELKTLMSSGEYRVVDQNGELWNTLRHRDDAEKYVEKMKGKLDLHIEAQGPQYEFKTPVHAVPITPSMRQSALEGQPMFHRSQNTPGWAGEPDSAQQTRTTKRAKDMLTLLRYYGQDKHIYLRGMQEQIRRDYDLADLPEDMNAYMAEETYHGRLRNRMDKAADIYEKSLLEAVADTGLEISEVGEWLHARHVILDDVNAKLRALRQSGNQPDAYLNGLSGLTDKEAHAILERRSKNTKLEAVGEAVDAINRSRLALLVNEGLLTAEEGAAWTAKYKHYVPLFRQESESLIPKRGSGFQVRGKESQRRIGSESQVDHENLLAHIVSQYETSIIRAEKARVGRKLLNMLREYPVTGVRIDPPRTKPGLVKRWTVTVGEEVLDTFKSRAQATKFATENGYMIETDSPQTEAKVGNAPVAKISEREVVQSMPDPRDRPNTITVKEKGVDVHIEFDETNPDHMRLVTAFRNLGIENSSKLLVPFMAINRFLSQMYTTLDPEFMVSNFTRDIQTALYNISDADMKGMRRSVAAGIPGAMKGLYSLLRKEKASGEWGVLAHQFVKDGGMTGWIDSHGDVKERAKRLKATLDEIKGTPMGKARKGARAVFDLISDYNAIIENSTRLSVYKAALDRGVSREKAASLAKNVTVNFNRKGLYGAQMNALYLFYNAAIQGNVRMVSALTKSSAARKLVVGTIAVAVALDILNRAAGGDDDDDTPLYDLIPDYIKERNLILMPQAIPGMAKAVELMGGDSEQPIKIPLPWGYNVFHVVGQEIGSLMTREDRTAGDSALRLTTAILEAFNPVGGAASPLQIIAPTVIDPAVQIGTNENWAGNPLTPEQSPFGLPKPNYQMHWRTAREFSKALAEGLNDITGGNEVKPGAIDVSPEWIDLFIDVVGGGPLKNVANVTNTVSLAVSGKPMEADKTPFLRRVYGTDYDRARRSQYYERAKEIEMVKAQVTHYRGKPELREIREENAPLLRLIEPAKMADKEIARLRKQLREAEKRGDDARAERIQASMDRVMARFNQRYNNAVNSDR